MRGFRPIAIICAAALLADAAAAAPPKAVPVPDLRPFTVKYEVYVGGLHFVTSSFLFANSGGRYRVKALASTDGFWHFMFPWDAEIVSEGLVSGDRFLPQVYDNSSVWRGDTKTISMKYKENREIDLEVNPPDKPSAKRNIVTTEERRGAMDPLAGIVQMLGDLAVGGTCSSTAPVFDGSRRFDLVGIDAGWEEIDPDGYGVYKGRARVCEVGFKMIAGEWKDRERSKFWLRSDGGGQGREPFSVWLAKLAPDLPEMAVRAESQSVWGRIVIHLEKWQYADGNSDLGKRK